MAQSNQYYVSAIVYKLTKGSNPDDIYIHINTTDPSWSKYKVLKHLGHDPVSILRNGEGERIIATYINKLVDDDTYSDFEDELERKYHPVRIAFDM